METRRICLVTVLICVAFFHGNNAQLSCGGLQTGSLSRGSSRSYSFTVPSSATYVTLSTCGSNFDTIYEISRSGSLISRRDDQGSCGTATVQRYSISSFDGTTTLQSGVSYTIVVRGFSSSSSGSFSLQMRCCYSSFSSSCPSFVPTPSPFSSGSNRGGAVGGGIGGAIGFLIFICCVVYIVRHVCGGYGNNNRTVVVQQTAVANTNTNANSTNVNVVYANQPQTTGMVMYNQTPQPVYTQQQPVTQQYNYPAPGMQQQPYQQQYAQQPYGQGQQQPPQYGQPQQYGAQPPQYGQPGQAPGYGIQQQQPAQAGAPPMMAEGGVGNTGASYGTAPDVSQNAPPPAYDNTSAPAYQPH